ncbi:MAG: HAD hydrolase family protein [Acidobacteriaceae bacterium]
MIDESRDKSAPHRNGDLMKDMRAIAFDVDGVLTDGGIWWGPNGEEWKRFCFADIMGVSRARKAGIIIALISGEDSSLVDRFAAKFLLKDIFKDCRFKAEALRLFADRNRLSLEEICFMGDDVNDLPAMEIVGLAAAPADARPAVLEKAAFVAKSRGGNGAARELIDAILEARTPNSLANCK